MLDPDLALALARKATPERMLWLSQTLKRRLVATTAGSSAIAAAPNTTTRAETGQETTP